MSQGDSQLVPVAEINAATAEAREILALDGRGRPLVRDPARVMKAVQRLRGSGHAEAIEELLVHGFLRDSEERYEECVLPLMHETSAAKFEMGSDSEDSRFFCGESPRHTVELDPFLISEQVVVESLFALLDEGVADRPAAGAKKPVVGISWYEASLFAMWVGCRLPTEAEWEWACGFGSTAEWCCEEEADLARWAWYSENAKGAVHEVACLAPNAAGLFDMHGNVWEWCLDRYDQDYYARSPRKNPINLGGGSFASPNRVTRGGSMNSLAEMCRTRYRFHEPPDFWAHDLGVRLARNVDEKGDE